MESIDQQIRNIAQAAHVEVLSYLKENEIECPICGVYSDTQSHITHMEVRHGIKLCPRCLADETAWQEVFREPHQPCSAPSRTELGKVR